MCFSVEGDLSGGSSDEATGSISIGHLGTSFFSSNPEQELQSQSHILSSCRAGETLHIMKSWTFVGEKTL